MNDLDTNQLAALTRVKDFGVEHPTLFPPAQLAGQLMTTITASVTDLNTHATAQVAGASEARQGTTSKGNARRDLRDDLEAINRTARAMALDIPGVDDKFRMPRGGDQNLLTGARAFVVEATPIKSDFIRFGLPENFLEDLSADIAAFEQATTAQNQGLEQKAAGTAAKDEAIDRGMKALKQLDVIMRNVLRDDVGTLTAWITASHVERVPHRRRSAQPQPPAPPGQSPGPPPSPPASSDSEK